MPLQIFDAARTHVSYILPALWVNRGVVIGAPTYEGALFPPVLDVLNHAAVKRILNKRTAMFGSYGWSGGAVRNWGRVMCMYDTSPDQNTSETLAMASAANGLFEEAVAAQTQAIFEAVKQGNEDQLPWMRENLRRYESGQPAAAPWSKDADVYRPLALAKPAERPQPES